MNVPLTPSDGERVSEGRERGLVYAVDIQQEMLDLLTNKLAAEKIFNVKPVLGTITDPKLPRASVDLILMVDVYHEFDHPFEMVAAMCQSLKPGGRIVFVEFRGEDPNVPIKLVHKNDRSAGAQGDEHSPARLGRDNRHTAATNTSSCFGNDREQAFGGASVLASLRYHKYFPARPIRSLAPPAAAKLSLLNKHNLRRRRLVIPTTCWVGGDGRDVFDGNLSPACLR